MSMVPYGFATEQLPAVEAVPLAAGEYHAVHFTIPADQVDGYLGKLNVWFEDRDEVILVAFGVSMEGEGFIVMEWEECKIDALFLRILEHEDAVTDVCTYVRSEEV